MTSFSEIRRARSAAEKRIGVEQHGIIKENIVDADDLFFTQNSVVEFSVALVKREPDAEMRVVIKIRAGRDDPVNKSSLDQRNQRGNPKPAGVNAPVNVTPIVTSSSSIFL